jgi:DUF1365 family protein
MNSAIYEGIVQHHRTWPRDHAFRYRLFMMSLDLSELDEVFKNRWLWSAREPNVAWLKRQDHVGDPAVPLDTAVRTLVEQRIARRPAGPITLLTHLRYFGYCMNPVSFFYCWNASRSALEAIVAEVHNTPWGQRHCYVLDAAAGDPRRPRFEFAKAFHVSPFMDMRQRYHWRFGVPGERLAVHMENAEDGRRIFTSTLALRRRPITGGNLVRVLLRFPLMTAKVVAAIYWQALRLRLKKVPFFPHPGHPVGPAGGDS